MRTGKKERNWHAKTLAPRQHLSVHKFQRKDLQSKCAAAAPHNPPHEKTTRTPPIIGLATRSSKAATSTHCASTRTSRAPKTGETFRDRHPTSRFPVWANTPNTSNAG